MPLNFIISVLINLTSLSVLSEEVEDHGLKTEKKNKEKEKVY